MIECPWCQNKTQIIKGRCEKCNQKLYVVSEADFLEGEQNIDSEMLEEDLDIEDVIVSNFKCSKCRCDECEVKEVAMSGTGLSKIFDIEHNHFIFVSCLNCGFVEIYNPDILRGKKSGTLGSLMDILFG